MAMPFLGSGGGVARKFHKQKAPGFARGFVCYVSRFRCYQNL